MANVLAYLHAVFAHWLETFGGIAVLAFLLYEKYYRKETHPKVFWGIAALLLCVGFYQAWLDEHRNVQTVIVEKAQLFSDKQVASARIDEKDKQLLDKQRQMEWLQQQLAAKDRPVVLQVPQKTGDRMAVVTWLDPGLPDPNHFLQVGLPLAMNLGYKNIGPFEANEFKSSNSLQFISSHSAKTIKPRRDAFLRWALNDAKSDPGSIVPPGMGHFSTYVVPGTQSLSQEDRDALLEGRKFILVMGYAHWKDSSGVRTARDCFVLQEPRNQEGSQPLIWHTCDLPEN